MKKIVTMAIVAIFASVMSILFGIVIIINNINTKTVMIKDTECEITYPYYSLSKSKCNNNQYIDYPQKIIAELHSFANDTIFDYSINMKSKRCRIYLPTDDFNKKEFRVSLIEFFKIKSDTLVESAFYLQTDSMKVSFNNDNIMLTTLQNIVANARYLTGTSIVLDDTNTTPFKISAEFLKIKDINKLCEFLHESYGLTLINNDSIQCVRITYH